MSAFRVYHLGVILCGGLDVKKHQWLHTDPKDTQPHFLSLKLSGMASSETIMKDIWEVTE